MSPAPVLDTHAWIWWVDQDKRLGKRAQTILDSMPPDDRPFICDISLWEVATLVEKGRIHFTISFDQWLEAAAHPRTVRILPITAAIASEVAMLPKNFQRDPADRVIVATCRVMKLPLLSKDTRIVRSRLTQRWVPAFMP